jgi:hypothetical protein
MNPASAAMASNVGRLLSRIWPGRNAPGPDTSSSPVDMTPTRGRGWARTSATPSEASTPTRPGVISSPADSTTSPGLRSSPTSLRWVPASTAASMRTDLPLSSRSVRSTMTTASAPSGSGAPVKMRIASPGPSGRVAGCPAATSATTGSVTGAEATSSARTA